MYCNNADYGTFTTGSNKRATQNDPYMYLRMASLQFQVTLLPWLVGWIMNEIICVDENSQAELKPENSEFVFQPSTSFTFVH